MRVGILFEGTFPYVRGGVSSWGKTLMSGLEDIEFTVIHVGANPERRLPKYKFSKNIKDFFEFFLFSEYTYSKPALTDSIVKEISDNIVYPFEEKYMSSKLYAILKDNNNIDFTKIFKLNSYWEAILNMYKKFIPYENFNYYYWNTRSMLIPFLNSLTMDIPKCDVYHSVTTGYAGLIALMASLRYKKPFIITEHGIYHRERQLELLRSKWVKDEYRMAWIKLFNTISALTYNSASLVTTLFYKNQQVEKELCYDHTKLEIIPNGVDYKKFSSIQKIKNEVFTIGLVGRVVEIKDIKTALKAIKVVSESIKVKFYVLGPTDEEPEYYQECLEMINVLELENIVEFKGNVNVLEWYPKLDLVLLSSVSEGQPLVLLEAMSAGIPCVATDVGACSEIINGSSIDDIEGTCGYIVKSKDFMSMAKKIIDISENKEFYKNASIIGKKRVEKKYNLPQMLDNYRNAYKMVVEKWQA